MIVRKLRMEKGFSQEQLAEMAGISTRTLQRIERGANASPETLKCIAAVLEIDFADLKPGADMDTNTTATLPELAPCEREAIEYVRDIKSFYSHALQYGVVMVGLLVLNLLTSPEYFWVIWPAMGWGIGVAAHGLSVFEVINIFGDDWEKKQISKRMGRRAKSQ
ncbi:helix-turn-helix domain-containing protein [Pseudophaeobacter sp. EL27]|uniref:helix-turn-helix domain-containing protein n=1 Tax=Pseudophaeobacter sp. EL27 TaxID=2107580 RepID=UPI000EFA6B1A|nr:helix-turn-helix domain-containing protein [Pseudophaeobacter sp. EL27]